MTTANEPTESELLNDAMRSTENAILDSAFTDETPADDAGDAGAAEGDAAGDAGDSKPDAGQPRNDKGQFAAKDKAAADGDQQQRNDDQAGDDQAADDKGGENDVPRWRLREIAEARRQAEARAQTLENELNRLRGQVDQLSRNQQQPRPQQQDNKPQEIDPLLDPQGFVTQQRNATQAAIREVRLETSFQIAAIRHGDEFTEAWKALLGERDRGNGALISRLTADASNAGEAVVRWFKQEKLLKATNGDLGKYDQTVEERLLNDPEFQKRAVARWTGEQPQPAQRQQSGNRPNTITRIPPSLSRQAGSSANIDPIDTDDSERAVFDFAYK